MIVEFLSVLLFLILVLYFLGVVIVHIEWGLLF